MKRALLGFGLALAILCAHPGQPRAWEPGTTHAGLAEQAALASTLHQRIEHDLGITGGLFAYLIVPPADAPELFELLRKLNPTHGYVPDSRGRQLALSWLAAGAVVADSPGRFAANHYLDPRTGRGLDTHTLTGLTRRARVALGARRAGETLVEDGRPADQWVVAKDNPLGLAGFLDQYGKAVSSRTPGERDRALAGALLAAGAIVHVVQDMASPSHVRVDLAAHLDSLGDGPNVGSRFERIAALAYGRLGVPAPAEVVHKSRLAEFFVADDGSGLAQRVARRFYSRYTLPADVVLPREAGPADVLTAVTNALERTGVTFVVGKGGVRVSDSTGTCLLLFEETGRTIHFFEDDDCVLSQLATLVPMAASYGAGALDFLFRGALAVTVDGKVHVSPSLALGDGTLELFWDDARGVRTSFFRGPVKGGAMPPLPAAPAQVARVVAMFRGVDASGEPVIAPGSWTPAAP